ncbi:MAG: uracil-DNA glycosylase [Chitinispirillia bacterium]|nr:uracil-DNA glycosylase [Chitinispirillia bacterium]
MSARSLLSAYLRTQRDLGFDELVFEHDSKIKYLINKVDSNAKSVSDDRAVRGSIDREETAAAGFNSAAQISTKSNFGNTSSASKLSKIKPLDTFNYVKLSAPHSSNIKSLPPHSEKREKLAVLYREAVKCDKCKLSQSRSKVIFGTGSAEGKVLVIGESPLCADDENAGLPFQGEAGELYHRILDRMNLSGGSDVFTTYLQKCRGVDENMFHNDCAVICKSLLDRQIEIIEPKALLVFGQSAANALFNNGDDIEKLRSANHTYKDIPVIVTYSLPLMNKEPNLRTGSWEDLKKILGMVSPK